MRKFSRLLLVLLLAGPVPGAFAATLVATVESLSGQAWLKAHPDDPEIALKPGRSLVAGTELHLAPGTVVVLKSIGSDQRITLDALGRTEGVWKPVPLAGTPQQVARGTSVLHFLRGGIGGLPRATGTALFAPADRARLVPGEPVVLRWLPGPAGRQIRITVLSDRGDTVWQADFAAQTGGDTSPALAGALGTAQAGGARFFSFRASLLGSESEPAEDNQCALLSPAKAAELRNELASYEDTPPPWRHVLRAALFAKFGVVESALTELDQVLADPDLGRQAEFFFTAARLHEGTGNRERAEALRQAGRALTGP